MALRDFVEAYIECALWSSCDDDQNPLDDRFYTDDIAPDTRKKMEKDCKDFFEDNAADLEEYTKETGRDDADAGHDFWLTRNGHGAGFWDRGMAEVLNRLTKASKVYGEYYLMVDENTGKVHGS